MSVDVKKVNYGGWQNCYHLTNGKIELIAAGDIGPRLLRCGFNGDINFFAEFPEHMGKTGGNEWRVYGGHRLWHSPETKSRCYYPDNFPLKIEMLPNGIHCIQPVEPNTLIQKEIIVTLDENEDYFMVHHVITNRGNWPIQFALWALSVMNTGGTAVIPQFRESDEEGLLPNRVISLWPYTDMDDSRVIWGKNNILVTQDPKKADPFKAGVSVPEGWACYNVNNNLFLKEFDFEENFALDYPDYGVNVEVYTNDRMLELETLSPMSIVHPGESAEHFEKWSLFKGVGTIKAESDVDKIVKPLLNR